MAVLGFARRDRIVAYGVLAGTVLTIIGVRFLIWPQSAAVTFGLGAFEGGYGLHYVIGLRDLWLGIMALFLAFSRSYAFLGLWFLAGATVCLSDAGVVWAFSGPWQAVAFHVISGVFCVGAGLAAGFESRAA